MDNNQIIITKTKYMISFFSEMRNISLENDFFKDLDDETKERYESFIYFGKVIDHLKKYIDLYDNTNNILIKKLIIEKIIRNRKLINEYSRNEIKMLDMMYIRDEKPKKKKKKRKIKINSSNPYYLN